MIRDAWQGAGPAMVWTLGMTDTGAACTLAERLPGTPDDAKESPDLTVGRARTAISLSALPPDAAPGALPRAIAVLDELDPEVRARSDIAALECRLWVNAVLSYGKGQRWDDMAASLKILAAVAERFRDIAGIQLRLAMGAANAAGGHVPRPLRAWAVDVLAGVSRRQPGDLQIQAIAQEVGLTASEQMTRAMAALQSTAAFPIQRPRPPE